MNLVEQAQLFAIKQHGSQQYGDRPYSYHLACVARLVEEITSDETAVAAAWLHDVMEDCDVHSFTIYELFGTPVWCIVDFCTDREGSDRAEKKQKTYIYWQSSPANENGVVVKLCDRLANVTYAVQTRNYKILQSYSEEHQDFWTALHSNVNCNFTKIQWDLMGRIEDCLHMGEQLQNASL